MFADDELTDDRFLGGRLQVLQPRQGYRAATDPVLLAAACPAGRGDSVLDLGCGVGTAALCLGLRVPDLVLAGVELQPGYAALARRNAARNAVALAVVEGDIAQLPRALRRDFDQVIANPPYFPTGGTPSPVSGRATAMQVDIPLAQWIAVAARRLRPGGWLTLICGTDGLPEVLTAVGTRLGSAVVLPLAPRAGRPARRVLVRARKGGRAAFRLLAPLVMHTGTAHAGDRESYTPEISAVLREGADLLAHFR